MATRLFRIFLALAVFLVSGCAGSSPRFTSHDRATPGARSFREEGVASFYAEDFDGKKTANGEVYDMNAMTAAHQTLPFNTLLKVTNLANGRSVNVRVNDRGPFKDDRIIDLSLAAAKRLGIVVSGTTEVRLQVIEWGE